MRITHEFTMALDRQGVAPIVDVVQGDSNTRAIAVTLTAGGAAFEPPEGTTASVAFRKPDGKKGWYDKLPDGANACSVAGNVVTAVLAPEALTVAGKVDVVIILQDQLLNQLSTFNFVLQVEKNPAAGGAVSNNYYNYTTMAEVNTAIDTFFAQAEADRISFEKKVEDVQSAFQEETTDKVVAVQEEIEKVSPAIVCEPSGEVITVHDTADRPLRGLTLYGKTTQNGSPTPDAPIDLVSAGDVGSIGVSVCGKNLIDADAMLNSVFTKDTEGIYHLSSPASGASWRFPNPIPANTPIHFKFYDLKGHNANSAALFSIEKIFTDGTSTGGDWCGVSGNFTNEVTILRDKAIRSIIIRAYNPSADFYCNFSAVQAEIGRTATEYEPYKGQTLTVSTPNGLPGVPVTNGGNYTDATGQRWICDEIDLAKGVYVKRIGKIASYAGETIPGAYMSTTGELSDGAAVLYALSAAIETALDTDTLESYAALHSNKPNATVYTDCNAGVKFEYIADTKAYIDNKFAELAAAIVANT